MASGFSDQPDGPPYHRGAPSGADVVPGVGLDARLARRAAIEWNYRLCTRPEQVLWARLSVFAGSFDLATAQEVCSGGELCCEAVIETVGALVDKSVLVVSATPDVGVGVGVDIGVGIGIGIGVDASAPGRAGCATYRMLDALREFGAEHLAGSSADAGAAMRNRFVAHYLAMAQRFGRDPMSEQLRQYHALRREHTNLRAAFDYALDLPGNASAAVSIATSLALYWHLSGQLREGEFWLNRVLARCPQPSAVRARVLGVRAYVIMLLGDLEAARADATAAVQLGAAFGDIAACGRGYLALHRALSWTGQLAEADEQAAAAMNCLGSVADPFGLASLDIQDAMLLLNAGEPDRVIEQCAAGMSRLPAGERWATGYLLGLQCTAHLLLGEFGASATAGRLGLTLACELGDVAGIACLLGMNAFLAAGQHRFERTAWLFGASAALWERVGRWYADAPALVALHRVAERLARSGLGDEQYWDSHARGRGAPLDRVVRLALADADSLPDPLTEPTVELKRVPPLGFNY